MASIIARLSRPYGVAFTMTARETPSRLCSARQASNGASGGVYGLEAAYGYRSTGPNTWQCVSHASGGALNDGTRGAGSGAGISGTMPDVAGCCAIAPPNPAAISDNASLLFISQSIARRACSARPASRRCRDRARRPLSRSRVRASLASRSLAAVTTDAASARGTTTTPSASPMMTSPGCDERTGAADRHVDRSRNRLRRAVCPDGARPHRKPHHRQFSRVSDSGVDHEPGDAVGPAGLGE